VQVHSNGAEPWKVTLVDTGDNTMTGGRLKRIRNHLDNETFCVTYGDGVTDANIARQIEFHQAQGAVATLLAVQPEGRFGAFQLARDDSRIRSFREKPKGDGAWINGGFFVLEPAALDYVEGDATVWEQEPLMGMARDGILAAYRHSGFWHPMDTLRDKNHLEELWASDRAPWKVW
jgi:glucose-1-phosphate cytidylyltransferase